MSAQGIKIGKKGAIGKGTPGRTSLMILFSVTIFVSAALLFLIEPMFAKFVLPSFGGTPAVWYHRLIGEHSQRRIVATIYCFSSSDNS